MRKVAPALLVLAILTITPTVGGDDARSDKPTEKTAGALLDLPQEVTLLLFNGSKRPVYLLKLTPEELTYKQSAKGAEVVKYSAKDGAVVEVLTPRGGKFVLNKATSVFEVAVPEPPADAKEGDKPKALELTKLEQAILDLTNEERKKASLPPLKVNEKLVLLARAHSENMAKQNRMDHVLDGKDPMQRARDAGYGPFVAENCAWGARSAPEVVRGWMESAGHKANILNKKATEVGIGHAFSPKTGPYYTQVFGFRRVN